jgi:hypothetical protein
MDRARFCGAAAQSGRERQRAGTETNASETLARPGCYDVKAGQGEADAGFAQAQSGRLRFSAVFDLRIPTRYSLFANPQGTRLAIRRCLICLHA